MRAFVPFARAGERLLLRLEISEPTLFAQQRSLRILTPVVFGLSFAVALLAIFFLRALVRPYEALLDKARALAPTDPAAGGSALVRGSDDEVAGTAGAPGVSRTSSAPVATTCSPL